MCVCVCVCGYRASMNGCVRPWVCVCVLCVCVLRASTIQLCASMGYGVNVCMCMNGATVHM